MPERKRKKRSLKADEKFEIPVRPLPELLQAMKNFDAQVRSQAVIDLGAKIEKAGGVIEESNQTKIRNIVFKLLEEDKTSEVKTACVAFLSEHAQHFATEHVTFIIDRLGLLLADQKIESNTRRDVASAVKGVVQGIGTDVGESVAPGLVQAILRGLKGKQFDAYETDLEMTCLDVLQAVLELYAASTTDENAKTLTVLLSILEHPNETCRLRGSSALGPMVATLSEDLFTKLFNAILSGIDGANALTYISTIKSVASAAGLRLAPHLDTIITKLLAQLIVPDGKEKFDDDVCLLWETIIEALTSLIKQCPESITDRVDTIMDLANTLLTFDPAIDDVKGDDGEVGDFGGDDEGWGGDDAWGGGGDEGWGADEGGDTDGFGGDLEVVIENADDSWKVRRAGVNMLTTFIQVKTDTLKDKWTFICDEFLARTQDSNPNVQSDILCALKVLLREAYVATSAQDSNDMQLDIPTFVRARSAQYQGVFSEYRWLILTKVAAVLEKKPESRILAHAFDVISELILAFRGTLVDISGDASTDINVIIPYIVDGVGNKEPDAAKAALKTLLLTVRHHSKNEIGTHLNTFANACLGILNSGLSSLALTAIAATVKGAHGDSSFDIAPVFTAVTRILESNQTHEAVKLAGIDCMGTILSTFGDSVGSINAAVNSLAERVSNETTREAVLAQVVKICESKNSGLCLSALSTGSKLSEICGFLRKEPQSLRLITARALESVVETQSLGSSDIKVILAECGQDEVTKHISDADLQLAAGVLNVVSSCLSKSPSCASIVSGNINVDALSLSASPMLQGQALSSLQNYFAVAASSNQSKLQFDAQEQALIGLVDNKSSSTLVKNVANCLAAITENMAPSDAIAAAEKFVRMAGTSSEASAQQLALLAVGDIGNDHDLSSKRLSDTLLGYKDSKSPDVRAAASYALGNMACGNVAHFLPFLLQKLSDDQSLAEILLTALKDLINYQSETHERAQLFTPHLQSVLDVAVQFCDTKMDHYRSTAAEILGRCALLAPEEVLPKIETYCKSSQLTLRAFAARAIRSCTHVLMHDNHLSQYMDVFATLLDGSIFNDQKLVWDSKETPVVIETIKNACAFFDVLCSDRPHLFKTQLLVAMVPNLVRETKARPALIHEINVVPKYSVDECSGMRADVFSLLQKLTVSFPKLLDFAALIQGVKSGVKDLNTNNHVHAFKLLTVMGQRNPAACREFLDSFVPIFTQYYKDNYRKTEMTVWETKDKSVKVAGTGSEHKLAAKGFLNMIRTMITLTAIPGVAVCAKFCNFLNALRNTAKLQRFFKEIEEDDAAGA